MDWAQFSIFIITMAGLFLWNRSESNSDRREICCVLKAIQDEIKEFHGRLCSLEERSRK